MPRLEKKQNKTEFAVLRPLKFLWESLSHKKRIQHWEASGCVRTCWVCRRKPAVMGVGTASGTIPVCCCSMVWEPEGALQTLEPWGLQRICRFYKLAKIIILGRANTTTCFYQYSLCSLREMAIWIHLMLLWRKFKGLLKKKSTFWIGNWNGLWSK